MAGSTVEDEGAPPRARWRGIAFGAVAGAALVALPAMLFSGLIRELAHPAVLVAFAVIGAIFGAFAWGAVAYERDHQTDDPTVGYREGILAEVESAEVGDGHPTDAAPEPRLV